MNTTSSTTRQEVCLGPTEEFHDGARRIVQLGNVSVGVFRVNGAFHAVRNYCPHEGADLCLGKLTGTNEPTHQCGEYQWGREGMILRCPWHGWEFDISSGESLFNAKYRIKTYAITIRDGQIWLAEKNRSKHEQAD